MLGTFAAAFAELFSYGHLLYLLIGVLVGLSVGIIPGLGGITGLTLLMPFIYGMDSVSALAMMVGLLAVTSTSDTFTSVLMGIPGTSSSQATILDGFPLSRQGEAARALSAAFISSLFGGLVGAVLLTFSVLLAKPIILSFGSAELFMLALFGLSMVGTLSGKSLIKGLCAATLGLSIGSIGSAPATGEFRLVAGIDYLYDGVSLVVLALGLFAIPEITSFLRQDKSISDGDELKSRGWLNGLTDWYKNVFLSLRCAFIGSFIGAIPGLGGTVVDWIAYGHAVHTTRDRSRFGKGEIRGVIAPESANNAKDGGALLPTLLFGIPGSGSMAVFLGGMTLIGIEPGPSMVTSELSLTYTIVWSLALANVLGTIICFVLARPISHLTRIRYDLLAPFMMVLICFAAFKDSRELADLVTLLSFGVLGILLRRFGWSRPAFLIGYILAPQAEAYLYQSVQFYGAGFLSRPGVLIIAVIIVASVWVGLRFRVDDSDSPKTTAATAGSKMIGVGIQIWFALAACFWFAYVFWDAWQMSFLGGIFVIWVGLVGASLSILLAFRLRYGGDTAIRFDQEQELAQSVEPMRSAWSGFAWLIVLVGLTSLAGFYIALVGFFLLFLRMRARVTWFRTLILTSIAAAGMLLLSYVLSLYFPSGLLQEFVDLPWPLN